MASFYNPACFGGFSHTFKELKISPTMRLDAALKAVQGPFGSTDCSLPMEYAKQQQMSGVDKFVVITDNETYAGRVQPVQALRDYRSAELEVGCHWYDSNQLHNR